ncbi:hypothetical protein COCSUDRAFT_46605 [Coccomyxa subellipsoidea C-169]|uniref:BZIP domain-containing protein n=1 Tax=Coccomyxa subellipsoidea (strain C-169) TaxID=574566 RepID=I0Z3C3_COCSC|nr:hypothetical protein COCSUDRAFT_46605 [Coccomyxa subellipsoidea C-169]EIE25142.1 hypothetical protein COCSUDRAFT_46605 [Coccomyxa subellipsoidea C-169]|eukprot:XP_005649686.1 hypothetical protein COCSUDRAFT_46605 [Coccomyxa subellipsoidea C-169]
MRNRSEREQTMNKLAQVRYRERKKAKAAELQAAIQALSERMQELTTAQHRNAELRRRNAELQQALTQQVLLLKDGMKGMSGLSNDKQEASCRSEYATRLDAIMQHRSKLNAEALGIFSSQMSVCSKADKGFFERASSLSLLRDIIRKLRANFRFLLHFRPHSYWLPCSLCSAIVCCCCMPF